MENFAVTLVTMCCLTLPWSVLSSKRRNRVEVLETRVNTLDMRAIQADEKMREMSERISAVNESFHESEALCKDNNQEPGLEPSHRDKQEDTGRAGSILWQDWEGRMMEAFKDEKAKISRALVGIDSYMERSSTTLNQQVHQAIENISASVESWKEQLSRIQRQMSERDGTFSKRTEMELHAFSTDLNQQAQRAIENWSTSFDSWKENFKNFKRQKSEGEQRCAAEIKSMKEDRNRDRDSLIQMFTKQQKDFEYSMVVKLQQLLECPDGWKKYNMFCYQFFDEKVTFTQAQARCDDLGGHVVDIQDMNEMDFVVGLTGRQPYWLGLTDVEEEGVWRWDRTKAVATFV